MNPATTPPYMTAQWPFGFNSAAGSAASRFVASRRYRWIIGAGILVSIVVILGYHGSWVSDLPAPIAQSLPDLLTTAPASETEPKPDVDWSLFAYTQYVTNSAYLCNSVMFFEALHRYGSKADRVMMYPADLANREDVSSPDARLIAKARDQYSVKLVPIKLQRKDNVDAAWSDSFTKLLAFNQTQYRRVISADSDALLLQHMDELFSIPSTPVAMPRAYWMYPDQEILASHVMLIEPSHSEFARIQKKIKSASENEYDMEIINQLYRNSALVLPHRKYALLSGEFRNHDHSWYLGSDDEIWNPVAAYNEAKSIHFSDWPLPKPWLPIPVDQREEIQPNCTVLANGEEDCTERVIWNGLYTDFKKKRKEVCG
ncbi:Glucose N-acetyltransferase 1 [Paramyrothecium foliicola]|nr:Glucose N-acetyltransferase 1 [Paramyrothecium foliicola]